MGSRRPYLLLDAGGVMLYPDPEMLAACVVKSGGETTAAAFAETHFRAVHALDNQVRETGVHPVVTAVEYIHALLDGAGVEHSIRDDAVREVLLRDADRPLWSFTHPWVSEALMDLTERGYRMAVVSNSDGRVTAQLESAGLASYFERIFDSRVVGAEKPDPAIFEHALNALGLASDEVLYCGDIYHVDVVGANRAGIGAIQVDPLGLYADWPGVRIRDLRELAERLSDLPEREHLFPSL